MAEVTDSKVVNKRTRKRNAAHRSATKALRQRSIMNMKSHVIIEKMASMNDDLKESWSTQPDIDGICGSARRSAQANPTKPSNETMKYRLPPGVVIPHMTKNLFGTYAAGSRSGLPCARGVNLDQQHFIDGSAYGKHFSISTAQAFWD
jgi:hypothetical protein